MTNNNNEKIAFLYTTSLNSGDFKTAFEIIENSRQDPELMELLNGINQGIYSRVKNEKRLGSNEQLDFSQPMSNILPTGDTSDPQTKFEQETKFERVMAGLLNQVTGRKDWQSAKDVKAGDGEK